MYRKSTAPPAKELIYRNKEKLMLRSHLYQARGLIGSDDSGLSGIIKYGPYCCKIWVDMIF